MPIQKLLDFIQRVLLFVRTDLELERTVCGCSSLNQYLGKVDVCVYYYGFK